MRKITALVIAALLTFALAGCEQTPAIPVTPDTASIIAPATDKPHMGRIGVAMPDKSNPRWERDGQDIKKQLEAKGYTVDLVYIENDWSSQNSQLEELIARGCKVLIIALSDGHTLDAALVKAKKAGVTVISYVYLLMDTAKVDYYVTFDMSSFGALQGKYIEDALALKDGKVPFNIELFTGSLDDGNVGLYYKSAMNVLRPYIDNGQLIVKSGQIDMTDVGTDGWKSEKAKTRMDNLLAEYYAKDKLDAVLCPNDSIALGVITSLEEAGYTEFPIITGLDCDKPNIIAMKAGQQSMSLFQDTRILAAKVVELVDTVMAGREVKLTGSNGVNFSMYHNGVKQVPSFLCEPYVVTADNIKEMLIDSGYYTVADLAG